MVEDTDRDEEVLSKFIKIADAQGNNLKRDLIASFKDDEEFLFALRFYLDDSALTGLKAGKLKKDSRESAPLHVKTIRELIEYLTKNNTGRSEDVGVAQSFVDNFSGRKAEVLYQLIIKRIEGLSIGIALANAAIPGFIEEVKDLVMLCDKFWDDPDYWEGRSVEIDPKLDGFRIRVEKTGNDVKIYSRSGKLVTDLPAVEASALKAKADFVLDGERMPKGFQKMTKDEQFKAAQLSRKGGRNNDDIVIGVYDGMSYEEWKSKKGTTIRRDRVDFIKKICKECGPNIEFVEPLFTGPFDLKTTEEIFEAETKKGKEGVIVKDLDAVYEWDRTKAQVKIKEVFDADLKVIDVVEGTGKNRGKLGAMVVTGLVRTSRHSTNEVVVTSKCGSGLTDEQRAYYWDNKSEILGHTVEVLYMQVSQDKDGSFSLRMPRFKAVKNGD
jgi:DNA ligase-1